MTPKVFLRLVRLQRVVAGLGEYPGNQARLAGDCGFSDQAHMVREFRKLLGKTPVQAARTLRSHLRVDDVPPETSLYDLA